MKTITQTMKFRQAIIEYSLKNGVTKAAIRYRVNRQYVYRWRKRLVVFRVKLRQREYTRSVTGLYRVLRR